MKAYQMITRRPIFFSLAKFILFAWLIVSFNAAIAQPTASTKKGCAPLAVTFACPDGYENSVWDFDDGNGYTSPNCISYKTFTKPGIYRIKYKGSIGGQTKIDSTTLTITVYGKPSPSFTANPLKGCAPLKVDFKDQTTGVPITNWTWSYGNGVVSTDNKSTQKYTYTDKGNYPVTLYVKDANGCDSLSPAIMIKVVDRPKAVITSNPATPATCTPPLNVDFSGSTSIDNTGGTLSYAWDFGNGNTGNVVNPPTQTYTALGSYTVKLRVTDSYGCQDSTPVTVSIKNPAPAFKVVNAVNDTVCKLVTFRITSIPATYTYNFGDNTTGSDKDSIHVYAQPGNYRVKLTMTLGGCTDTISIPIVVQNVQANFSVIAPAFSCNPPYTVQFQDKSINAKKWYWKFADGQVDSVQNPKHTYLSAAEDSFAIHQKIIHGTSLFVTSKYGCVSAVKMLFLDTLYKPTALFVPDSAMGCVPMNIKFNDKSTSQPNIVKWDWRFGDGQTSNLSNPSHSYTNPGRYYARLIITNKDGCIDSSYKYLILAGIKTHPNFKIAPNPACSGDTVKFTDLSTPKSKIDTWHYSADNKLMQNCQNEPNPYWKFKSNTGLMDITLTTGNLGCLTDTTIKQVIKINGPIAQFSDSTTCANPLDYTFKGKFIDATAWDWDFGDGTPPILGSTAKTVTHTYVKSDSNYTVKLKAYNSSNGCPPFEITRVIKVRKIVADFTGPQAQAPYSVCQNSPTHFSAKPSLDVKKECGTSYRWYIYDTSATQPILKVGNETELDYAFKKFGKHTIKLEIKGENGCISSKTVGIKVYHVTAKIIPTKDTAVCLNTLISFTNKSTGDTTLSKIYGWYVDGAVSPKQLFSNLRNTSYKFNNPMENPYYISMTVKDTMGCADTTKIVVNLTYPDTTIISTPANTNICAGTSILFRGNKNKQAYTWDFKNGNPGVGQFPLPQTYLKAGQYLVTVNVKDSITGCTGKGAKLVQVQNIPNAGFTTNVDGKKTVCAKDKITFKDTTKASIFKQRYWNLGVPFTISPNDSVSWQYQKGYYQISLIVETTFGCRDTSPVRTIRVVSPAADFTLSKDSICKGEEITLTLKDTTDVYTWSWDYGDGSLPGKAQSPITHRFNFHPSSGNNTINLTFWSADSSCRTPISHDMYIQQLIANFKRNNELLKQDTAHCLKITDNFKYITSPTSPDVWHWNFGDGQSFNGQNAVHTYQNPGQYYVQLDLKNNKLGCVDTIKKLMTIYPDPDAKATGGVACYDTPVNLSASGGTSYSWNPTSNLNLIDPANPVATPTSNTTYTVTVTDINSCTASAFAIAVIHPKPKQVPSATYDIIIGDSVSLDMNPNNGYIYAWTPSTGLSCDNCAALFAHPEVDTKYKVVIRDTFNCPPVTSYFDFTVKPHAIVVVPTAFTPNNDGHNDIIYARGKGVQRLIAFKIYNRWGQLVFESQDMDKGWDGTFEGKEQPADTYVYTVTAQAWFKNEIINLKGGFELLR